MKESLFSHIILLIKILYNKEFIVMAMSLEQMLLL